MTKKRNSLIEKQLSDTTPEIFIMMTDEHIYGREIIKTFIKKGVNISKIIVERNSPLAVVGKSYLKNDFYSPPDLSYFKKQFGLKIYYVNNLNSKETVRFLRTNDRAIAVLGGSRILKESVLKTRGVKFINAHPGLLPNYRGLDIVAWAILNGDPVGSTAHFVNAGIDSGNIIIYGNLNYSNCKSLIEVRIKNMHLCVDLLIDTINIINNDWTFAGSVQNEEKASYYKSFPQKKFATVEKKIRTNYSNHETI